MRGREMAVTGRHGDRLMARRLLNLFDRRSCHSQPGAESMPVRVPDVSCDARLFETGLKP